jgi:hypothetical protein
MCGMYNIGKYMKKIISCGKRSVNKTGPNLPDYAYFDGKELFLDFCLTNTS